MAQKFLPGDLVRPISSTPLWSEPGERCAGMLEATTTALVLDTRPDPSAGWTRVLLLADGVQGWVLDLHIRRIQR